MGAWGVHFDESDAGLDFLGDAAEGRDWSVVEHRITDFVDDGGYDDADEALAAIELVAAALGRASPRLAPELREWAGAHQGRALDIRDRASRALMLVRDRSELSELWAEADEGEAWLATISDLEARLSA